MKVRTFLRILIWIGLFVAIRPSTSFAGIDCATATRSTIRSETASANYAVRPMLEMYHGEDKRGVIYLQNEFQRRPFLVHIKEGRLFREMETGILRPLDTSEAVNADAIPRMAIFVMDENGAIYVNPYARRDRFHHSSFLAGRSVAAAGLIEVSDGVLLSSLNRSGHYPDPDAFFYSQFLREMKLRGVVDRSQGRFRPKLYQPKPVINLELPSDAFLP